MAENSSIEWTNHTFNPVRGCTKVSPGCTHCYAETGSGRAPAVLGRWGPKGTRSYAAESAWKGVLKWDRDAAAKKTPARVFCASLADVFEEWEGQVTDSQERPLWCEPGIPYEDARPFWEPPENLTGHIPYTLDHMRARLFALIRATPNLHWQLLTKRPENIARMMPAGSWPNVWLGTSVETQEYTWRIDALKEAPQDVPVRFLSLEPLLGPLHLWDNLQGIQWVIVGGESGGEAREIRLSWVRSIVTQCIDAHTPLFVKQLGKIVTGVTGGGRRYALKMEHDTSHGGDMQDWPEDIRIREFPIAA